MGGKMSKETYFELINNTNRNIINTTISGLEEHDWIGDFRPDKNLSNRYVSKAGGSIRNREELCGSASHCFFTMELVFSDDTRDAFRVHQMSAVSDCCDEVFRHFKHSHDIDYKRVGGNTLRVTVENTQDQLVNERAEETNKTGEEALRKKMYELAIRKFKAAKNLANEESTMNRIQVNLKKAENANRATKLNEEGKELMKKGYYESSIRKFDAALKAADSSLIADISSNRRRAVNARAEEINREGEEAMRRKSYTDAMEKFDEALAMANETTTREKIMENKYALRTMLYRHKQNEKAVEANRDGEEAFRKGEYETAMEKFRQAYRLANEMSTVDLTKRNLVKATNLYNAQQKNEEGRQLLQEKKYKESIENFDEALKLAEGSSLVSTINNNRLQALEQYGKALYNEGWLLESNEHEDMSREAEESFKKARDIFTIINDEGNLKLVKLKMAGNELFNEGAGLENEASNLYQTARRTQMVDDYETAQRKYEDVVKKYEEAKKKLEEGASDDEMFASNVKYVKNQIDTVSRTIGKIEQAKLSGHVKKVMFDTKKNSREDDVVISENVNILSDAT